MSAAPVLGYRLFRLSLFDERPTQPTLRGLFVREAWSLAGPTRAKHSERAVFRPNQHVQGQHPAPHPSCACGLYAWWSIGKQSYMAGEGAVVGAVIGWGHVLLHNDGWRAEYARPVAFLAPVSPELGLILEYVATRLGAPIVPDLPSLQMYAAEFGESRA